LAFMGQQVQRIKVIVHVAVGRIDHCGAAVQNMIAREQQAVFQKCQTQMIGRMSWGVQDFQAVLADLQNFAMG